MSHCRIRHYKPIVASHALVFRTTWRRLPASNNDGNDPCQWRLPGICLNLRHLPLVIYVGYPMARVMSLARITSGVASGECPGILHSPPQCYNRNIHINNHTALHSAIGMFAMDNTKPYWCSHGYSLSCTYLDVRRIRALLALVDRHHGLTTCDYKILLNGV